MKVFRLILPFVIGFTLILAFPYVGNEIIDFFYGNNLAYEAGNEISDVAYMLEIFGALLVIFLLMISYVVFLNMKGQTLRISYRRQFLICLLLSSLAYVYLVVELTNAKNLSVGLYLTVFRDDPVHMGRLLSIGANPNLVATDRNPKSFSVLMIASGKGNADLVNKLLRAGASKTTLNVEGKAAADIAKERGHNDIYKLLQE